MSGVYSYTSINAQVVPLAVYYASLSSWIDLINLLSPFREVKGLADVIDK